MERKTSGWMYKLVKRKKEKERKRSKENSFYLGG
jgi:hypothetical protein